MKSEETIPQQTYSLPMRQSSINVCLHCKMKFLFKYRWLIFPKRPVPTPSASTGRMTHLLLAKGPDYLTQFDADIQTVVGKLEKLIDEGNDPFGEVASLIKSTLDSASKAKAICTIAWERFTPPANEKVLCLEREISTVIILPDAAGHPHELALEGVVDKLTEDTETGRVWTRDFKSSTLGVDFTMTGYPFSTQCRFYRLLAESFLYATEYADAEEPPQEAIGQNPRVFGFCVDWMKMPNIVLSGADRDYTEYEHTFTRGARKGETEMCREYEGEPKFDNYVKRCIEWYAANEEETFQSFAIAYTEPVIPTELYSAMMITNQFTRCDPDPKLFSRDITTASCKSFNRQCPYYALCQSDYAAWPSLIDQHYEQRTPEQVKEEIQGKDATSDTETGGDA